MSTLKKDELKNIFQYLNALDLHNASQVCRSWSETAIEENNKRIPTWIITRESVECLLNWENFKTQFIDNCRTKPSLHFMFYNVISPVVPPEGCYCKYLKYHCNSIVVKHYLTWITKDNISNIFFPKIPNIKITTISLNNYPWDKQVYCLELKCLFELSFSNANKLKTIFEPFTGNDIPMSSCVIFIYNIYNIELVQNFALRLKKWFPNKKMSILSIETDRISICHTNSYFSVCQQREDCIAILLNGTNMESWTHELELDSTIEADMTAFKNKVNLKKHSVCFMGTTKINSHQFDCKDEKLFQTSFPNVPLFIMPCIGSVATNKIENFYNSIGDYEMDKYTGFLLLTYD